MTIDIDHIKLIRDKDVEQFNLVERVHMIRWGKRFGEYNEILKYISQQGKKGFTPEHLQRTLTLLLNRREMIKRLIMGILNNYDTFKDSEEFFHEVMKDCQRQGIVEPIGENING